MRIVSGSEGKLSVVISYEATCQPRSNNRVIHMYGPSEVALMMRGMPQQL